jgi:hypothetical protein
MNPTLDDNLRRMKTARLGQERRDRQDAMDGLDW